MSDPTLLGVREAALQTYRKSVLSAFSDVEKALIALQQTGLQEKYQREAVLASQMAFYLSEQQLREGTVNLAKLVKEHGFKTSYREIPGRHYWFLWRDFLANFAQVMFQPAGQKSQG